MVQIPLGDEERRILVEILEGVKSDLRMEIANTDQQDFRDMLKRRKNVVSSVIEAARLDEESARLEEETGSQRPIGPGG